MTPKFPLIELKKGHFFLANRHIPTLNRDSLESRSVSKNNLFFPHLSGRACVQH